MTQQYEDEDEDEGGGVQPEVLKSYLAFGLRALSEHRWLSIGVFAFVTGMSLIALAVWPRTYQCETKLMTQASTGLAQNVDSVRDALNFKGAHEIIMRHDNLVSIVRQTDLVKHWTENRPFILGAKDAVMNTLRGKPNPKDMEGVLVYTLKTRMQAQTADGVLTLSIEWPDAGMAARLLEVATQNFLEARHVAEISTIADYIAILEGHAVKLRTEIDKNVEQIQRLREEKLAQYGRRPDGAPAAAATPAAAPEAGTVQRAPAPPRPRSTVEQEDVARLRVQLEAKQRAMAELEDNRDRRLAEQQARLRELSLKYTEAHPLVEDAKQNVRALAEDSQQVLALRKEIQGMDGELTRKRSLSGDVRASATGTRPATGIAAVAAVSAADPLPPEVLRFLQDAGGETFDPAVAAQFRHSVEKYTNLRGTISTARIDLDTAQAAFQYRYKVMVPPEAPDKPVKPKVALVAIGGIAAGLFLGILAALILALRSDRIVERWQVHQLQLPVLSELQLHEPRNS
jgi:hypothetical protein